MWSAMAKKDKWQPPYPYERWASGIYQPRPGKGVAEDLADMAQLPHSNAEVPPERRELLTLVYPGALTIEKKATLPTSDERWEAVSDGTTEIWTPKETLSRAQKIPSLAAKSDLLIDDSNAGRIVKYLSAVRRSGKVPSVQLAGREGAHQLPDGRWGWVMGEKWIGPRGTLVEPMPIKSRYSQALASHGDLADWVNMYVKVLQEGEVTARWLINSMFGSFLLRFLNYRTFVVHHFGETAGGKSATADYCASVNGVPKRHNGRPPLRITFNATELAIQAQFKYIDDFPMIIDELQAAKFKDKIEAVRGFIYNIVLGEPRQRCDTAGQLPWEDYDWRCVVRTTGEQPLIPTDAPVTGAVGRILQIQETAMTSNQARSLHQWMERKNCYGLAGPAFLRALLPVVNDPTKLGKLQSHALEMHDEIVHRVGKNDVRLAHLVPIAMGQTLAAQVLLKAPFKAAKEGAIEDAIRISQVLELGAVRMKYSQEGMAVIRQHIAANPTLYPDMQESAEAVTVQEGKTHNVFGVFNGNAKEPLWLIPAQINPWLVKNDINPGRFWGDMRKENLITTYPGGLTVMRTQGRFKTRVYALTSWVAKE